ncbi:type II toxin-antitoxin system HipA family toxin [Azospirillum thermophilum]|uniref:Phosphatidylinositol kinase n=1 Tax=Azospirillum thermophilum TaxID=2202148 RepID=A0A2S2CK35_9PROT|nr:HipA domain-containing protein [Azospirillum thermophilum]AWK84875.1 phosphatidylinositol kinase [Azospirillum thermophilum]
MAAERSAEILFKDRPVGVLLETPDGGTRFVYGPDVTETIACALPVATREHGWPAGLHPVFQHLGPEGWLREKQARAGRVEEEDDFGLLLRYGRDCIGAIGIRPVQPITPSGWGGDAETRAATVGGRTVSGVQKKLLAYHDGDRYLPAEADGPATHIAKYNGQSEPTLVRNELLSLRLARDVLGAKQVTAFDRGFVAGLDEPALIVTRFDRTATGAKLRLEDFAQILARPQGRDFGGKYAGSYEEIAAAIRQHSARPLIDLDQFFRCVVFCVLIGNADAHLKNFSLLETPDGLRLSPAYDLLNTLVYRGAYKTEFALALGGDRIPTDRIDRRRILAFAEAIGLPAAAARLALRQLRDRIRRSTAIQPPDAEPEDGFLHRYAEIVENACSRLFEE